MPSLLSALLVQDRVVSFRQMDAAVRAQQRDGGHIGTCLLELEAIDEGILLYYESKARQVPSADLEAFAKIPRSAVEAVDSAWALRHKACPVGFDGDALLVASVEPLSPEAIEELGRPAQERVGLELRVMQALHALYGAPLDARFAALLDAHPASVGVVESDPEPAAPGPPAEEEELPGLSWPLERLSSFLAASDDRDALLMASLGFLGKFFARRMFLVVGRSTLRGHALHMPGKPARPIAKAELPLEGGQLSALVSGDSYFLGTCEEAGVSALYDHLGVSTPPDCLALPIRVGPRAALLLLADNAAQPVDHRALPIATVVVRQLSAALERLIRTIKSRHTSAIPGVNAEAPAHLSADAAPIHEEPSRVTQELLLRVEGQAAGVTAGLNAFDSTEWALPEDWDDVDALQTAPEHGPARQTRLFGAFEQPQRRAIDPDPVSERESIEAPTTRLPEVAPEPPPTERVVVDDGGEALTEKIVVAGAVDLGASTSPLKGRATTQPTPNAAVKAPTRPTSSVTPQHAKAEPPSRQTLDPPARAQETKPAGEPSVNGGDAHATRPTPSQDVAPAAQPVTYNRDSGDHDSVPVTPGTSSYRRAVELDVSMPGVLQTNATPAPMSREQRAIAEAIFEAPNDVLAGWLDDEDEARANGAFVELLNRGPRAFDALYEAFPGPLRVDRRAESATDRTPLEEHGPLLWLCALQLLSFRTHLTTLLTSEDDNARYYATRMVLQAADPMAIDDMVERLFDHDAQIRTIALHFVSIFLDHDVRDRVLERIRASIPSREAHEAEYAIHASTDLGDLLAIPQIIEALRHKSVHTRQRAAQALSQLTFQDHGLSAKQWTKWYQRVGTQPRLTWLLEAMVDKDWKVRDNAAKALAELPRLMINYHPDLNRAARAQAAEHVRAYFTESGA